MKTKGIIFNIFMVLAIAAIAVGGVIFVRNIKSGKSVTGTSNIPLEDKFGTVTATKGNVRIERKGIGYSLLKDTVLLKNDNVTTLDKSSFKFDTNNSSTIITDENSKFSFVIKDSKHNYSLEEGNIFANVSKKDDLILSWKQGILKATDCVLSFNVNKGVPSVKVYSGTAKMISSAESSEIEITQGNSAFINSKGKIETQKFNSEALKEFDIQSLKQTSDKSICFTADELQNVLDKRAELLAKIAKEKENKKMSAKNSKNSEEEIITIQKVEKEIAVDASKPSSAQSTQNKTEDKKTSSEDTSNDTAESEIAQSNIMTATIEINCQEILSNKDKLKKGKDIYVPDDGVILNAVTVEFTKGETVFDVLKRVCDARNIQMEYSWFPIYNSNYIEGINNLYEKECGDGSGWLYYVNGWRPNYGVSVYKLNDGDYISFDYTCTVPSF